MKRYRLLGLLTVCLLLSMSLFAKDIAAKNRVIGADRVKTDTQPQELLFMLMDLPFNQGEINLFLNSLDPMEEWINEHREEWNRVDKSKNPIPATFALDVWKSVDLDAAEYIALAIKLTVAQGVLSGSIDAKKLEEQKEFMEKMINDPNLPEKSKADLKKGLNTVQQLIEALGNYPADNKRLFEENRKKLEEGLARFKRFGKPSDQEVAEKPATESVPTATAPSWINQKIKVSGTAVIDNTKYKQPGQAKLWAKRAATFDAKRRLLDLVLALRLDSQTMIRDVLTEDDLDIYNGIVRNSYYVDEDSNDTIYTFTLGLSLNDVYSYMKGKGIYYK